MAFGIALIVGGILIALYPPLLSVIVAFFLISIGATFCVLSYRYKKMAQRSPDPFVDFFFRF